MPLTVKRLTPWLLTALLLLVSGLALAQAPHPFGVPERTLNTPSIGWFSEWTGQIAIWQSQFYRQLTTAVRVWRDDGFQAWWLLALSFGYGVFHALGPGHGKMVLSAYVLANRETLRNGALLAFISSLVQALVAIALVGIAAGILNVTGAVLNEVTALLELGAYAVLILLGAWLVFKYTLSPLKTVIMGRSRALAVHAGHGDHHGHHHGHDHHDHQHHSHDENCGHTHMPHPDQVAGKLNLKKAWGAILAIGLRPCSGAILVLVFALSQQFFLAGVASALAMGLGTGLTVAALAMGSLSLGRLAEAAGGGKQRPWGRRVAAGLQALASLAVLLFGVLLFSAAWQYQTF